MSFEIRLGMRRIRCTVSAEALEAVARLPGGSTTALRRRSFDRFRTVIEAAARLKLGTLPGEFCGTIALSPPDLNAVPSTGGLGLGQARGPGR